MQGSHQTNQQHWPGAEAPSVKQVPWNQRDQALLVTARAVHACLSGTYDSIPSIPVDFVVDGNHPDNKIIAGATFSLFSYRAAGDGTYVHNDGFFFATGGLGLALTAGFMAARAAGNSERRRRAMHDAQLAWRPVCNGLLYINQYGFYFRTPNSLSKWVWNSIVQCQVLELGCVTLIGDGAQGRMNYMIRSDYAELIFAFWAMVRAPQHPQYLTGVWLPDGWVARYKEQFGTAAADFSGDIKGLPQGS